MTVVREAHARAHTHTRAHARTHRVGKGRSRMNDERMKVNMGR